MPEVEEAQTSTARWEAYVAMELDQTVKTDRHTPIQAEIPSTEEKADVDMAVVAEEVIAEAMGLQELPSLEMLVRRKGG